MKKPPQISVVIPVYNKEKYLENTIESVLSQNFKDFELILINDGSTDGSESIIKAIDDPRIKYFKQANSGVAIARNKGVAEASASLIAFLDADDIWLPEHLDEIYRLYTSFPEATFYATGYQIKYFNRTFNFVYPFKQESIQIKPYYKYDKGQALFYVSNFAIKKDIFEKEKGFKTGIDGEDTEFYIRLGLKYPMAYSKKITLIHIDEAENSLFAQYKIENKVKLLKYFEKQSKTDADLKKYLDQHRYAWIIEYLIAGKKEEAQNLKKNLNTDNLNRKQKLLINLSPFAIKNLKMIQNFFKRQGLFISAFSNS